jgi:hypothetical protein
VVPGGKSQQPDPALVQAEVLRYADNFFDRTSTGLDEYARIANTHKAHEEALSWKLAINSSALSIATGANPTANLVDFLALSSLNRAFVEVTASAVAPPHAMDLWLQNTRALETNAWTVAERFLTPEHQAEIRASIERWLSQNSEQGPGFFLRPQELAMGIRQSGENAPRPGSVFSLIGLDPTAGLDPAIREVTRTRLLAERAMFALQRMPFLVRWQTEMLADHLLRQEQITNALSSAERISGAVESLSQTAAALPDRLTSERKAVLEAFEVQEGKLRDLSAQVGQTLAASERMSTSLNTTLITFDALMKRFGVGEPPTGPPDTNSPPFNILDYARTAEQVATMAAQLDALIKDTSGTLDTPALDKRMADLKALSGKARADAKSVLNHAFLLAAGLIVLSFACALGYRRLAPPSTVTQ